MRPGCRRVGPRRVHELDIEGDGAARRSELRGARSGVSEENRRQPLLRIRPGETSGTTRSGGGRPFLLRPSESLALIEFDRRLVMI